MAEEHGFQSSEGHRLCVNNCGFFGNSATLNMCSKCYRTLKPDDSSLFSPPPSSSSSAAAAAKPIAADPVSTPAVVVEVRAAAAPQTTTAGRCSACRKKVGLTGFRCRCGTTFCGTHRYPERHGCTFDFKAVGREAIARENPLIKADKLEKI